MTKRHLCLLALPLLSIPACLDTRDQDPAEGEQAELTTASPQAAITGPICETFGSRRCVGAPTIAFEDHVVETAGGRILRIVAVSGGVNLRFDADPTKCVAVKNASTMVEVRACTVETATWTTVAGPDGHSCLFRNAQGGFLSGPNNGGQFNVVSRGASGWLQQFTLSGFACV